MAKQLHLLKWFVSTFVVATSLTAAALSLESVEFLVLDKTGNVIKLQYRSTGLDESKNKHFYGHKLDSNFAFCDATDKGIECSASRGGAITRRYKIAPANWDTHAEAKAIVEKYTKNQRSIRQSVGNPLSFYTCEQGCESDRSKTMVEVSTEE